MPKRRSISLRRPAPTWRCPGRLLTLAALAGVLAACEDTPTQHESAPAERRGGFLAKGTSTTITQDLAHLAVDQSQTVIDGCGSFATYGLMAQTFVPAAGYVLGLDLYLSAAPGHPNPLVDVSIYEWPPAEPAPVGDPLGTVQGIELLPVLSAFPDIPPTSVVFPEPIRVEPGTTYAWVVRHRWAGAAVDEDVDGEPRVCGSGEDLYADGQHRYYHGQLESWMEPGGDDAFKTYAALLTAPAVTMTDLGTLGGPTSVARGINNSGFIVGGSYTPSREQHVVRWNRAGPIEDLGTLAGDYAFATDINAAGQIVGESRFDPGLPTVHAILWDEANGMRDLGALGDLWSAAYGINDLGQVVGARVPGVGGQHAFLWDEVNGMRVLGTLPGGDYAEAHDVNESGQVVGFGNTEPSGLTMHAFLWDDVNGMRQLADLGGGYGRARSINDAGQIAGWSRTGSGRYHAVVWDAGTLTDLGTLPGYDNSAAFGINRAGQVVGWSYRTTSLADAHAFLWDPVDGMTDLGTLGGARSTAAAINDAGQVVGWSLATPGGPEHAFLWPGDPGSISGDLGEALSDLADAGVTNQGQANALSRKIDQAMRLYEKGKYAQAVTVLEAFVRQVSEMTLVDGVLTREEAASLVAKANGLIAMMEGRTGP